MKAICIVSVALFCGSMSRASGWRCYQPNETLAVKLYNHTNPLNGTTNPARLVISENGSTIVAASGSQIEFLSTSKGTDYHVKGESSLHGCWVTFHVNFVEGAESIPYGAIRRGYLAAECEDGTTTHQKLLCKRYLKNP